MTTFTVPARCNGPAHSGNGGYCAGLFATLVGEPAEISLRRPIPLDSPLTVAGHEIRHDGDLIAAVAPAPGYAPKAPPPVTRAEAEAGRDAYRGARSGAFSMCFVCGRGRPDAMGVFAGQIPGRQVVATPWTPTADLAGPDGAVDSRYVWAALDCPTYSASFVDGEGDLPVAYLGNVVGAVLAPVPVLEDLLVIAWPTGQERRKHWASSAILDHEGTLLAACDALMIRPKPAL
jgi:hypothetical protein